MLHFHSFSLEKMKSYLIFLTTNSEISSFMFDLETFRNCSDEICKDAIDNKFFVDILSRA